jgi:hypothetical protein
MRKTNLIVIFLLTSFLGVNAQRYNTKVLSVSNDRDNELAPVIYDNGLVFMSNRVVPSIKKFVNENGDPLTNLYYVPIDENGKFGRIKERPELPSTDGDDGPLAFAQAGQMMCICLQNGFAGQNQIKNGNSGLYFSYMDDGRWTRLEAFEWNDIEENFSTPFLTEDGNTLYFAADGMDDSFGGWDIYVSRKVSRGWTKPENLGSMINTSEWELFPYLHPSGRLYFSSRGHNSRGGSFDLFYTNYYNGIWGQPIPVPSLNSFNDDMSLIISEDLSEGYITRKAGNDFDILRFEYPNYETFDNPRPIQKNRFCFRLRENSLDTIDYNIFSYEWVINWDNRDSSVAGHDIKFCFPGPGEYNVSFNVTNKLADTVMYGVASLFLDLQLQEQVVITAPDSVKVNEVVNFDASETNWKRWKISGYYWDFGNGVQDKGEKVSYAYPLPNEYTVVLGIKEGRRSDPEKFAVFKKIVVLPAD